MDDTPICQRYRQIQASLREAAESGGFPAPKLLAVTKNHPVEEIIPLKALGVTDIGENRVQEIDQKWPDLQDIFRIHCIGRLQSNKVKYIIDKVYSIQSLDRMSLAQEIERQAYAHGVTMPVLVQVSPAGEEQKGGVPMADVRAFLQQIRPMKGLQIRGLMAMMPNTQDEAFLLDRFRAMRTLFEQLREEAIEGVAMEELSMGMSGDYLLAARCGATMVRIGSALMGPRDYKR